MDTVVMTHVSNPDVEETMGRDAYRIVYYPAGWRSVDDDWDGAVSFSDRVEELETRPAVTNLAPVATSGAYADLSGRPSLSAVSASGSYPDLVNRPTLASVASSGAYTDLTGRPTLGTAASQNTAAFEPSGAVSTHAGAVDPHGDRAAAASALATHAALPAHSLTTVKLTADHAAFSLITMANVTGLVFAVTAGTLYRFSFYIVYRTAATTTGIRLGITCPAFTVLAARATIPIAADGASAMLSGWLTTSGDSVVGTGVQAANTDYLAVVEGTLLPSANGNLQLQAGSEVAASAVTVRNGSHAQMWAA